MIIQRVAVLSGFGPRVTEKIKSHLHARQFKVVVASNTGSVENDSDNLLKNMDRVINDPKDRTDVKIVAMLVSCLSSESDQEIEQSYFFPILRRREFDRIYKNDINRAVEAADSIVETFKSVGFTDLLYQFKKPIDMRLLLPIKNTPSKRLKEELLEIYNLQSTALSRKIDKEITRIKKSGAWSVKSLVFDGAFNGPDHPIRRCTDSLWCDIAARLRLGLTVDERFEFDVSSEGDLSRKSFFLCDGSPQRVSSEATHLNMRINDDFKW